MVTKETLQSLILDAGVVYLNYGDTTNERILGATEGGNTFTVEREIREIPFDGMKGKTKGARRIIREDAKLTVNLKELTAENIATALAGATISEIPDKEDYQEIRSTGFLQDSDYIDNVALVATISGSTKPVVIILENVLSDGNFEIGATDKEEAVIAVEFSAHYDPDDLEADGAVKVPYTIHYPEIGEEGGTGS